MSLRFWHTIVILIVSFLGLAALDKPDMGVTKTQKTFFPKAASPIQPRDYEIGKAVYTTTCIKCHNANPTKPGPIGPELYTTPNAVFHTKVPTGTYPQGYVAKRKTKIMPNFLHLTNKVDSLYHYIRSFK